MTSSITLINSLELIKTTIFVINALKNEFKNWLIWIQSKLNSIQVVSVCIIASVSYYDILLVVFG